MINKYITFKMQKSLDPVRIKPSEITSFSVAPEGGTRIVTRQKQVYYVTEKLVEVEDKIDKYFNQ